MSAKVGNMGGGMRELLETITNSGKNISDDTLANWKNIYPFLLLEFVDSSGNAHCFYSTIVSSEQFYYFFNGTQSYTRFYGTDSSYGYILSKDRDKSLFVARGNYSSTLKIYGMIL